MRDYEIVILGGDARPKAFVEMQEAGDDGAIRAGVRIAGERPFEVWRDLVCVHRKRPATERHAA